MSLARFLAAWTGFALVCIAATATGPASATDSVIHDSGPLTLAEVDRLGGLAGCLTADDDEILLAQGGRIATIDASRGRLRLMAISASIPDPITSLARDDDRLFAAAGAGGVYWFDVADSQAIELAARLDLPGPVEEVTASGDLVAAALGPEGLALVRPIAAKPPTLDLAWHWAEEPIYSVALLRGLVVAAGHEHLIVVDPEVPAVIGSYPLERGHAVTIYRDLAYVADNQSGLRIVDLADPTQPAEVGALNGFFLVNDILPKGAYTYLATELSGVVTVSTTRPSSPEIDQPSYYDDPVRKIGNQTCLAEVGTGMVSSGDGGVTLIERRQPNYPRIGQVMSPIGAVSALALTDQTLVAVDPAGLRTVDVSAAMSLNGDRAELAGSRSVALHPAPVAGEPQQIAFVTHGSSVSAVDVSDPTELTIMRTTDVESVALGIDVVAAPPDVQSTTRAFISTGFADGLSLFEVHPRGRLNELGRAATPGDALSVSGTSQFGVIAYVADGFSGVAVFDTRGGAPELLRNVTVAGRTTDVDIRESALYATSDWGLQVFDISDPTHPTFIVEHSTPWKARFVRVLDDELLLGGGPGAGAQGIGGLQLLDINDPRSPLLRGSWETEGTLVDAVAYRDRIAVAAGDQGIIELAVSTTSPGTPSPPRSTDGTPSTPRPTDPTEPRAPTDSLSPTPSLTTPQSTPHPPYRLLLPRVLSSLGLDRSSA